MNDEQYLQAAAALAQQSTEPIKCAAILVDNASKVVAEAFNTQRTDNLTASHAEMKAIAQANATLGRDLSGITVYGNCEPCTMCLTALIFAGVERIVFSQRLNDLLEDDQKIAIDCFDFVKKFPYQPKLEFLQMTPE